MRKLSKTNLSKAKTFLATRGRQLELSLFNHHFSQEEDSRTAVIEELSKFQNVDGGFGNALEPDVRMKGSSVIATKYALQILIDIKAPATEKLVKDCIAYLLDNYDHDKQIWPLVTAKVMDAPHAPWWDFEELEKEFGGFLANPRAGILRCLLDYIELVPEGLIDVVTNSLIVHFKTLPVEMEFFDAISFLQLLQSNRLDKELRELLFLSLV